MFHPKEEISRLKVELQFILSRNPLCLASAQLRSHKDQSNRKAFPNALLEVYGSSTNVRHSHRVAHHYRQNMGSFIIYGKFKTGNNRSRRGYMRVELEWIKARTIHRILKDSNGPKKTKHSTRSPEGFQNAEKRAAIHDNSNSTASVDSSTASVASRVVLIGPVVGDWVWPVQFLTRGAQTTCLENHRNQGPAQAVPSRILYKCCYESVGESPNFRIFRMPFSTPTSLRSSPLMTEPVAA
jgi:hypothetical protein